MLRTGRGGGVVGRRVGAAARKLGLERGQKLGGGALRQRVLDAGVVDRKDLVRRHALPPARERGCARARLGGRTRRTRVACAAWAASSFSGASSTLSSPWLILVQS